MGDYFSDLEFLDGAVIPDCAARLRDHVAVCYSLEFIRSGRLELARGHGPSLILDRPAVFWHRPGGRYDYGACDDSGWYHHWFTCRGERAERLFEAGFDRLSPHGYVWVRDPVAVGRSFEQIISLLHRRTLASHAQAVCLAEELLAALMDDRSLPDHEAALRQSIEELGRLIQKRPELDLDFNREAERLNMSYSHFRRCFRLYLGRAPHDYQIMARMYKAVRKLMQPELPIKRLASEVGYDDPAQFSRAFRRAMGLSPQKFREGSAGYLVPQQRPRTPLPADESAVEGAASRTPHSADGGE